MNSPHISTPALSRRTFLRWARVTLALPLLEAMRPVFGAAAAQAPALPRRMVGVETNMGFRRSTFFLKKAGRDFALSPYLESSRRIAISSPFFPASAIRASRAGMRQSAVS